MRAHYTAAAKEERDAVAAAGDERVAAARRERLLQALGAIVRERRLGAKLTLRALAAKSGLSERFLGQLEAGDGNISIVRLAQVAGALDARASELLREAEQGKVAVAKPPLVSLVGLRGAGKSTVGELAADRLGVPFYELDKLIAEQAGMDLATLFEIHGDAYFRRVELATLKSLLDVTVGGVIATGGSIVTSKPALALLKKKTKVVWLEASPDDHWERVVAQGDVRPMKNRANAMSELRALLRARRPLYARAHHTIHTSGVPTLRVVDLVVMAAYEGREADAQGNARHVSVEEKVS